jgi:hypothetical protein
VAHLPLPGTVGVTFARKDRRTGRRMARHGVCAYALVNGETIECMVNDVSTLGIRLIFPEARRLPSQLAISITPNGKPRLAHVRWQRGKHAGIEFA